MKYTLFWGGIFSQWYKAPFTIKNKTFNCCEQFMMYEKAKLFGDMITAEKIMAESNPRNQKALGRQVRNFEKSLWDKHCFGIVYQANLAKFTQNTVLQEQLLATGDNILVEASPQDNIWGIGLAEGDEGAYNPRRWEGTNLLGFALTTVKHEIKHRQNVPI